jgi:hypothetical protein
LVAHLHFSNRTKAKLKMQKSYQANAPQTPQSKTDKLSVKITAAGNISLAKTAGNSFD